MKDYLSQAIDLTGDAYLNPVPAIYDNGPHIRNVSQITSISCHHDASPREHDYDSVSRFKQEAAGHYARLGPGLQYHYKIDNVGQIFKTRPLTTWLYCVGSAENVSTLAICLDGYFSAPYNEKPTREQMEALGQLLVELCENRPDIPATYPDVRPHRDFSSTNCLPLDATELLTPDGWVWLSDVTISHKIAQWADGEISFANPSQLVEPYDAEVHKLRWLEATADHEIISRLQKQTEYTKKPFSETFVTSSAHYIPSGGNINTDGLPLTDDEIRMLVWIQGDGYYRIEDRTERIKNGKSYSGWTKSNYGIEWHLKKMRKILRITGLLESLGWDFRTQLKGDGSASVIAYGGERIKWAEEFLDDKCFSWDFLNMSQPQFEIFKEELLEVDGCRANNSYSSSKRRNIDVVQAVFATHGGRANQWASDADRLGFSEQPLTLALEKVTRTTRVGCVTVPAGNILIRQNGRTMVVGNCPGDNFAPWVYAIQSKADVLNIPADIVYDWPELQPVPPPPPPAPTPAPPTAITYEDIVPATYVAKNKTQLQDAQTGVVIQEYNAGQEFDLVRRMRKGSMVWLQTAYSVTKTPTRGIPETDLSLKSPGVDPTPPSPPDPTPVPVPTPPPTPDPADQSHDYSKENNSLLKQLLGLIQSLIDKISSIFK